MEEVVDYSYHIYPTIFTSISTNLITYIPPLVDLHFSRTTMKDIFGSLSISGAQKYLDSPLAQNIMVFSKPIKNLTTDGFEMYGVEKLFKHELEDVKFPMTI